MLPRSLWLHACPQSVLLSLSPFICVLSVPLSWHLPRLYIWYGSLSLYLICIYIYAYIIVLSLSLSLSMLHGFWVFTCFFLALSFSFNYVSYDIVSLYLSSFLPLSLCLIIFASPSLFLCACSLVHPLYFNIILSCAPKLSWPLVAAAAASAPFLIPISTQASKFQSKPCCS